MLTLGTRYGFHNYLGAVHCSAVNTMTSRILATYPSSCESNSTYDIEFPGPYLLCNGLEIRNVSATYLGLSPSVPNYSGVWSNIGDCIAVPYTLPATRLPRVRQRIPVSSASFNTTLFQNLQFVEQLSNSEVTVYA